MACFLVTATEALVVTALEKAEAKKEIRAVSEAGTEVPEVKIPLSRKLKWLGNLLWGGAVLLAFEHVWHGEVTPWFPFLTAMGDPADAAEMFREMGTVGVGMAALITAVWGGMCVAANAIVKRKSADNTEETV